MGTYCIVFFYLPKEFNTLQSKNSFTDSLSRIQYSISEFSIKISWHDFLNLARMITSLRMNSANLIISTLSVITKLQFKLIHNQAVFVHLLFVDVNFRKAVMW